MTDWSRFGAVVLGYGPASHHHTARPLEDKLHALSVPTVADHSRQTILVASKFLITRLEKRIQPFC